MIALAGKDVEQGEHSSIAGGSANLYSHYGNQCRSFSESQKEIQLEYSGVYPNNPIFTTEMLAYACLLLLHNSQKI